MFAGDVDTLLVWKFLTRFSEHPDRITNKEFSLIYQAVSFRWSMVADKEDGMPSWYRGDNKVLVRAVAFLSWLVTSI